MRAWFQEMAPESATRVGHPAPFPVELPERLIQLYTYRGDSSPGQANGQGIQSFGGVWHPLAKSGQPVSSSGSSGGGY